MIEPHTIFRKTAAGVDEIATRTLGLRAESRRLLILIDGRASVAQLANYVRHAEVGALLAILEGQGLIVADTAGAGAGAGFAAGASGNVAPTAFAEPSAAQIDAVRRVAIERIEALLGTAAAPLVRRLDGAFDARELRDTISGCRHVLDLQLGKEVGQRFLEDVRRAADVSR